MTSFQEIKDLFTSEIINTPQYQIAVKIKNLIIQDIIQPNVNFYFSYELQNSDYTDNDSRSNENQIILMSLRLILGFDCELRSTTIYINMNKFLE